MQTSEALKRVFAELNLQLIKEVIFNTEGGPIEAVEIMRVSEYLVTTIIHVYNDKYVVHINMQVYLLIDRTLLPGLFF